MRKREELKDDATRAFTSEERARREKRKQYANEVASTDQNALRAKWRDKRRQRLEDMTPAELEEFREKNRAYQKAYYQKNADQAKQRAAQRRIDKAAEIAQNKKDYRETHKEEIAAADRQRKKKYRETHKEQVAEQRKVFRELHKEEIATYQSTYYQLNKERLAAKRKAYYQANKERLAAQRQAKKQTEKDG